MYGGARTPLRIGFRRRLSRVVVAAFPDNGRTTRDGIHFVWGVPLHESPFRTDPAHPTTESDLVAVLSAQTERPVHLLSLDTIRAGEEAIRRRAEEARSVGGYLLCDGETQGDLTTLAKAFAGERCMFGSSAIGEEIPKYRASPAYGMQSYALPPIAGGVLLVAGSVTPQTKSQVAHFIDSGGSSIPFEGPRLFDSDRYEYQAEIVDRACRAIRAGVGVLVYTRSQTDDIERTYRAAAANGVDEIGANIAVSRALGGIARAVHDTEPFSRLIVAGGETSNHVCEALGLRGNVVLEQIEPGLPVGVSIGAIRMMVVLKSGSFGKSEFLTTALNHMADMVSK